MLGMPYNGYLVISQETYRKLLEIAQDMKTTVDPLVEALINKAYDEMKEDAHDVAVATERDKEPTIPFKEILKKVKKQETKNAIRKPKKRKPRKRTVAVNDA
jgi:hypothetical protein